jgi:hypothetical protein
LRITCCNFTGSPLTASGASAATKTYDGTTVATVTLSDNRVAGDLFTDSYADVDLRDAINAGQVPGPHMQVSGPALGITGGHCDNDLLPFEYHSVGEGVADGIAAVQHKVRQNIKYGADLIKICATGGVLSKGDSPEARRITPMGPPAQAAYSCPWPRRGRQCAAGHQSDSFAMWRHNNDRQTSNIRGTN